MGYSETEVLNLKLMHRHFKYYVGNVVSIIIPKRFEANKRYCGFSATFVLSVNVILCNIDLTMLPFKRLFSIKFINLLSIFWICEIILEKDFS